MSRDSTTTAWSLVTYRTGDDPVERVGSLGPEGVVRAAPELCEYRGLMPALEDWPEVAAILERCDHRGEESVGDAKVLAPLRYPRKILCAGAKYWSHLREMGGSLDQGALEDPSFFLLPATSIVGHGGGDPIEIPTDDHANVDWEGELAVVIGRPRQKRLGRERSGPRCQVHHLQRHLCPGIPPADLVSSATLLNGIG